MVREICKEDYEKYVELADAFYHSPGVLHAVPLSYIETTWQEMMRSDVYVQGYMLETEGVVAGYALTAKTFSQEAGGMVLWLEELYISPEYQGHGLGKEFFTYVNEKLAPAYARIRLEVEPENVRAKSLYSRLGYEELPYEQMIQEKGE